MFFLRAFQNTTKNNFLNFSPGWYNKTAIIVKRKILFVQTKRQSGKAQIANEMKNYLGLKDFIRIFA